MNIYGFLHTKISQLKYKNVLMLQVVTALNKHENMAIMIKRNFDEFHLHLFKASEIDEVNEYLPNVRVLLRRIKEIVAQYRLGFVAVVLLSKNSNYEFVYYIFQWNLMAYTFSSEFEPKDDPKQLIVRCNLIDPNVDIEDVIRDFNVVIELLEENKQKYIIEDPSPFVLYKHYLRKEKIQKLLGKELKCIFGF